MNEEKLNLSIRKFLKGVGINSQRIIEQKVREVIESGENNNLKDVKISMHIKSPKVNIDEQIEGEIEIDNS